MSLVNPRRILHRVSCAVDKFLFPAPAIPVSRNIYGYYAGDAIRANKAIYDNLLVFAWYIYQQPFLGLIGHGRYVCICYTQGPLAFVQGLKYCCRVRGIECLILSEDEILFSHRGKCFIEKLPYKPSFFHLSESHGQD